jgi:hypothetical protein
MKLACTLGWFPIRSQWLPPHRENYENEKQIHLVSFCATQEKCIGLDGFGSAVRGSVLKDAASSLETALIVL